MKKISFLMAGLIALLCLFCGPVEKKEGSRFNRLDETSPEYTAKATEYMANYFKSHGIQVDSIHVDGNDLRIRIDTLLTDSLYRLYTGQSAVEYYNFKRKNALIHNMSIRVYCGSKRGLVAQASYP